MIKHKINAKHHCYLFFAIIALSFWWLRSSFSAAAKMHLVIMRINQAPNRIMVVADILNYRQWKMKVTAGLNPA